MGPAPDGEEDRAQKPPQVGTAWALRCLLSLGWVQELTWGNRVLIAEVGDSCCPDLKVWG